MKIAFLITVLGALAASAAQMQTTAQLEQQNSRTLDKEIAAVAASVSDAAGCFERINEYKADHAETRRRLNAEHKGSIPAAFNDLLWMKSNRVTRARKRCVDRNVEIGKRIDDVQRLFVSMYPPSPNAKAQRAKLNEIKKRHLDAMARDMPAQKGAPAAPQNEQ